MRRICMMVAMMALKVHLEPLQGEQVHIDFENLPTGTILSNQIPGVSFASLTTIVDRPMFPTSLPYPEQGQGFAHATGLFQILVDAPIEGWISFDINFLEHGGAPLFSSWNRAPVQGPQVYALEWSNAASITPDRTGPTSIEYWREQDGQRIPIPFLIDNITFSVIPEPAPLSLAAAATAAILIIGRVKRTIRDLRAVNGS